ncbi:hypothetical protein FKQ53_02840 [Pandoraea pnomenusa]|nr:hypothetical protein FKQ53_02840 [Pandoraea pnomenusa]
MASFLNIYLTEYDDSLSGDSYVDPIGTLIVWSALGRQVFDERVNSVSNDVRNYTLNLFHHHLVRRLTLDSEVQLSASLRRQYRDKAALAFKQASLILLENLFVFSLLRHEGMAGVDTGGVLGISKARRRWEQDGEQTRLLFTHGPDGQILVRQLGLGVSGRYKTPLMKIGFFDADYQYHLPKFQPAWLRAESFIRQPSGSSLAGLERAAYGFLKEHLPALKHMGAIHFESIPCDLTKAYARAFGSSPEVGIYARNFWLAETGLDTGAAGALFDVLLADIDGKNDVRETVERAIERTRQPEDKIKLEQIARVEPLLADCALLFSLMTTTREHSVDSVAKTWREKFGRTETRLPELADRAGDISQLHALKGTQASKRFVALQQAARSGSLQEQIQALAKYHGQVMENRGQPAWLSIDDGAKIKVHARTSPPPPPDRRPPGSWLNNYYIPQFASLVKGLQGVGT